MIDLPTRIDLDREAVRRRGLAEFVKRAWRVVEPNPLRWSWHMDAVCAHLQAVSRGEIRDLVICVPPGMSKSLIVSTFWPAWDWIEHPARRLIAATYAQDLSDKNAELHRNLVQSEWYQARWGDKVRIGHEDKSRVRMFRNSALGWRFSSSVAGAMTGFHADHLLFDDLVKAQDSEGRAIIDPAAIEKANAFWFKTMYTRRADAATTARVGIAQRLHHEDTPGKCIEAGYTALVLPMEYDPARPCSTRVAWTNPKTGARELFKDPRQEKGELLAPDRFPREVVDVDKSNAGLGAMAFEAQAQQNPTPREGAIFKAAKIGTWKTLPTKLGRLIVTVDCSFKDKKSSDFVAIQTWAVAGPDFYLVDRWCDRAGLFGTVAKILEFRERYPLAGIYVEDKANGPAVIEVLKGEIPGIHEWSPGTDSKESRANAVSHLFDSGNVYLPEAPWVGEYLSTLTRFPLVKHDDDVDATTMALLILYTPRRSRWLDAVAKMRQA